VPGVVERLLFARIGLERIPPRHCSRGAGVVLKASGMVGPFAHG